MWVNNISRNDEDAKDAFDSLEAVFKLQGEPITTSSMCAVHKVTINQEGYFVKRYRRGGEGIAEFFGISKAHREWNNLKSFSEWGLPAAKLAAYGEEWFLKIPRRGVVITYEIRNSTDLAELSRTSAEKFKDRDWFNSISIQVAKATRVMHEHKFAHNDWKWRNILVVDKESGPEVFMIDCPSGMKWFGPFFEYRRIKDLACLDKIGKYTLSKTQRLKFYLQYVQRSKLTSNDKKDIKKILAFFKGRE